METVAAAPRIPGTTSEYPGGDVSPVSGDAPGLYVNA